MVRHWQIAAGSEGRDYSEDFLKFGMAFVGGQNQRKTMATVEVGDRILLKRGRSELVAAGRIVTRNGLHRGDSDKHWLRDFDGWDLPAWCYVDWHVPSSPIAVNGFTRSTIQQVWIPELITCAEKLLLNPILPYQSEPQPTRAVSDEQMVDFLIGQGLRIAAAEDFTAALRRIRR